MDMDDLMDLYRYGNSGYGYRSSGLEAAVVLGVLAFIIALTCTVLIMVLVTPERRRAKLNKFFRGVADICNFRGLLLEYIVRALYIFFTLYAIVGGFFSMFTEPLSGLLTMILGPIVLRVLFEFTMMFILLVKNVIQLNNKVPGKNVDPMKLDVPADVAPARHTAPATPVAPVAPAAPVEPQMVFYSQCGTRYDANQGGCPNGCKE